MNSGTEGVANTHPKGKVMTPKTSSAEAARDARIEEFLSTLVTDDDVTAAFLAMRTRFNLVGNIFTRTDIEDTLHSAVEGHDTEGPIREIAPTLVDAMHQSYHFRRVVNEQLTDAGGAAMDEEIRSYLSPLMGFMDFPNVLFTTDVEGAHIVVDNLEDLAQAQDFLGNVLGKNVDNFADRAHEECLNWIPVGQCVFDRVITGAVLLLDTGYAQDVTKIKIA